MGACVPLPPNAACTFQCTTLSTSEYIDLLHDGNLCPFLEHLDIPSNFFISLTDSIYYPPFQSLVGLEATTLPPSRGVFASIAAGLYSCGSCVLSHKLRHPLQVVLWVIWWFRHHTGRSRPVIGDPVFPKSQSCDTFR